MEQPIILIGIAVILIGFLIILAGAFLGDKKPQFAVGGFIDPIPLGFANSREMLYVVIALSVGMFLLSLYLSKAV